MILTCPNCTTRFKVPDKVIGTKGRKVKCKKCAHGWFQHPEGYEPPSQSDDQEDKSAEESLIQEALGGNLSLPEIEEPPEPAEEPEPPVAEELPTRLRSRRHPAPSKGHKPPMDPKLAAGGLAAAVGLVLAGLIFFRTSIVHGWPPAALLYDTLGFPVAVPGEGLQIRDVIVEASSIAGIPILRAHGMIRNLSDEKREIPPLLSIIRDKEGFMLTQWDSRADQRSIVPGESVEFTVEYPDPHRNHADWVILFTDSTDQD